MDNLLVVLLFVALGLAAIGLSFYLSHRRTQAVKALATQWGFEFHGAGNHWLPSQVWSFQFFNRGRSQRIFNLMRKSVAGGEIALFDYSYRTGSGKNSQTHRRTALLISDETLNLPQFFLMPEGIFHKIGNVFGYRDIDFDSYPTFSKRYLLRGSDEEKIRALFNYETIPFYEHRHNAETEGIGGYFLYHFGRQLPPTKWNTLEADARELQQSFRKFASHR
jgi:hypothetical protein